MPRENKATDLEVDKRVDTISEMILQGASQRQMFEYAKKEWDIGERQTKHYISKCYTKFEALMEKDAKKNLAKHIQIRNHLYRKTYKAGDYKTALSIQKDKANLQGLYQPQIQINNYTQYNHFQDMAKNDPDKFRAEFIKRISKNRDTE